MHPVSGYAFLELPSSMWQNRATRRCSMLNKSRSIFLFCFAVFSNSTASAFNRSTPRRRGWVALQKGRIKNNSRRSFVFASSHPSYLTRIWSSFIKTNLLKSNNERVYFVAWGIAKWQLLKDAVQCESNRAQTMPSKTDRKCVKRCHRFNRSMISSH